MTAPETLAVMRAVRNETFPPTNPAVLLAAARDAYLSGIRHREIAATLAWCLWVMAMNVPEEFTPEQRDAIGRLYGSPSLPMALDRESVAS